MPSISASRAALPEVFLLTLAGAGLAFALGGSPSLAILLAMAALSGLSAAAADLAIGYGGVFLLGPALPFAIGAYALAMAQQARLPFAIGLLGGAGAAAALAAALGAAGLNRQHSTVQFALLSLVVSLVLGQLAVSSYDWAGGSNGLPGILPPTVFGAGDSGYAVAVLLVTPLAVLAMLRGVRAAGPLLRLQRDNPAKAESMGYAPKGIKIAVLAASAAISASAGALYVPLTGIAYPGMFAVLPNLMLLVSVALGGRGTLIGPFVAAALFFVFQFELGSFYADAYMLAIGVLLIAFVRLVPRGLWPRWAAP